jgi:hypothetical protein
MRSETLFSPSENRKQKCIIAKHRTIQREERAITCTHFLFCFPLSIDSRNNLQNKENTLDFTYIKEARNKTRLSHKRDGEI